MAPPRARALLAPSSLSKLPPAAAVLGLAACLTGGCGTSRPPAAPAAQVGTTAPPTPPPPTTGAPTTATPTLPAIAGCTPARPADVEAITAGLQPGLTLRYAFTETTGLRRWVNAHIYRPDGQRVSSADVWIIDPPGVVFSLSGSARQLSGHPDGRTLRDGPSAGDDVAVALERCVLGAARAAEATPTT